MKTEQERIEQMDKMAQVMCGFCTEDKRCVLRYSAPCSEVKSQDCSYKGNAEMLICAGYGDVSEYKAEIKKLKAEFKQLETNAEILARGVRDLNHENYELTEKIKQAQIDVLNKVKDIVFDYLGVKNIKEAEALSLLDSTLTYDVVTCGIDELIKEVQNAENKG